MTNAMQLNCVFNMTTEHLQYKIKECINSGTVQSIVIFLIYFISKSAGIYVDWHIKKKKKKKNPEKIAKNPKDKPPISVLIPTG